MAGGVTESVPKSMIHARALAVSMIYTDWHLVGILYFHTLSHSLIARRPWNLNGVRHVRFRAALTTSVRYALFLPIDGAPSSSSMYVPPLDCKRDLSGVFKPGRCDLFPEGSRDLVSEEVAEVKTVVARWAARCMSGRSAGSAEPMSATLGSTCDGIQNVVPYSSNCGGTSLLISYCNP